jgi:hypothetical protein
VPLSQLGWAEPLVELFRARLAAITLIPGEE